MEEDDDDDDIRSGKQDEAQQEHLLQTLKRRLSKEFRTIGGPAFVQLCAEPLAGLVDTAYLGRLSSPAVLGGVGVAVSAQYAIAKLYHDPLLRTTISLVATKTTTATAATATTANDDNGGNNGSGSGSNSSNSDKDEIIEPHEADDKSSSQSNSHRDDDLSVAVTSAMVLAAVIGVAQMVVYGVFGRFIVRSMGVSMSSSADSMWHSAVSYLQVRALGTPAATLWLVANGIFRGLGDTRTPLVYSLAFTALNAVLDPLFIFGFGWGAPGAAAGTAIAQYAALLPLLYALHAKVGIGSIRGQGAALVRSLRQYVRAGGLVLVRTFGKVLAYSVTARHAALLGPVSMAAYNLTFQLGFATTQICEAVAVAVQTLIAREMASQRHPPYVKAKVIRHLIATSLWLGGGVAALLSLATLLGRDWIVPALTSNAAIQAATIHIFPVVLLTQVLKGLAYPVNGTIMGGLDWVFSMVVMWMSNLACVGLLRYYAARSSAAAGAGVGGGLVTLGQIWTALAAFMATQVVAGVLRYTSQTGVWKVLRVPPLRRTTTSSAIASDVRAA
jgi:putative MATE family efflux protein